MRIQLNEFSKGCHEVRAFLPVNEVQQKALNGILKRALSRIKRMVRAFWETFCKVVTRTVTYMRGKARSVGSWKEKSFRQKFTRRFFLHKGRSML